MKITKAVVPLVLFIILLCNASAYAQNREKSVAGQKAAQEFLQAALMDSTQHNVVSSQKTLIKSSTVAVQVAEPILFSIYGQENIKRQRPYEAYLLDGYWVITGTLPRGHEGGTFLLIMDASNCRIIQLTHGK